MAGEDLRLSRGPARARLSVGSWGRRLGPDAGSRVGEVEGSDALPSGLGAVSLDEFQLGSQGGWRGPPADCCAAWGGRRLADTQFPLAPRILFTSLCPCSHCSG